MNLEIEENINLDLPKIKGNLSNYSTEKLCEMIACGRYFGLDQELIVLCMQELGNRRNNGNDFDFETHIDNLSKDLPVIDTSFTDFKNIIKQSLGKLK